MRNTHQSRGAILFLSSVLLIFIWAFFHPQAAQAQWSTSSAVTSTTDTVGVGTTAPDRKVEIVDSGGNSQLRLTFSKASSLFTDIYTYSSGQFIIAPSGVDTVSTKPISINASGDTFRFYYNGGDQSLRWAIATDSTGLFNIVQRGNGWLDQGTRFTITRSGNVGIGTTSPAGRFEIVNASGGTAASNYFQLTGSTTGITNLPGISFKGGDISGIEYPFVQAAADGLALTLAGGRKSAIYPNRMQLTLSSNSTGTGAAVFDYFDGSVPSSQPLLMIKENGLVGVNVVATPGYRFYVTEQQSGYYVASFRHNQGSTGSRGLYVETNGTNAGDNVIAAYSSGGNNPVLVARADGTVGIGKSNPTATLDVAGSLNVSGGITGGTINARYQDVAEWVPSSQKLRAGTVVILDPERTNQVIASSESYDTRVAGVISDSPGVILGEGGEGKVKVATTGRVKVKVDASRGPIKIGDLLVTSDKEGVAMKSVPVNFNGRLLHSPGTIIGKALEPLEKGESEILVLLSLQ